MNDLIFAKCENFPGPGTLALPVELLPLFPLSFSFSDFLLYHSPVIFLRNLLVYVNHSFFSRKFILFFFLSVCVSMCLMCTHVHQCAHRNQKRILASLESCSTWMLRPHCVLCKSSMHL